jgi:hypothetical protein
LDRIGIGVSYDKRDSGIFEPDGSAFWIYVTPNKRYPISEVLRPDLQASTILNADFQQSHGLITINRKMAIILR